MSEELGCAQNADKTLKDAHEVIWTHSHSPSPIDLSTPVLMMPAVLVALIRAPSHGKAKKEKLSHTRRTITSAVTHKQRLNLTNADKLEILDFAEGPGKGFTQARIAEHFRNHFPKLHQSSVHSILKKRDQFRQIQDSEPNQLFYKHPQHVKFPKLENALILWINTKQNQIKITGAVLRAKAEKFAEEFGIPNADRLNLWVDAFKLSHGIREYQIHGEAASVSAEAVAATCDRLKGLLSSFKPCDIYKFDETGLYYHMPPDKTLATKEISGGKGDKTRFTLGFIANADGTDI
ncbi:hypothetical protein EW145_g5297 [Phellinidium pouzarii]|uniref:HTH CENPB-type domain-containing protein n=1 Tax=Phellinidium pouzarii TaxID=167371 RepID=A0A4V3XC74_9AGAM|nr:hypothetical protein EW145_g5297 [Phellinidium pouzarii]